MRKFIQLMMISCACLIVASCSREATIAGTAEKIRELALYTCSKGEITLLDTVKVSSEDGSYQLVVELPYEGFYLIGRNENVLYPIYLKNGESLEACFQDNSMRIVGNSLSKENEILEKWENGVKEVRLNGFLNRHLPGVSSAGYEIFFAQLENAKKHQTAMLEELDENDGKFYTFMKNKVRAELDFYAMNFLRTEGMNIPDTVKLPEYYNNMGPDSIFVSRDILDLPYSGNMLEAYVWYMNRENDFYQQKDFKSLVESFDDKDLQQSFLLSEASGMRYYDEYQKLIDGVGEDFFTSHYREKMREIEEELAWSKPGIEAPDFKAMAPDSSWMHLSDYRGKVVVADVWATWCEPCRRMMPMFHQLQKEFDGQNVAFLSICVGVWVEMDKWIEMSREFHIEKDNFFVNGWKSDFVKAYRVTGVPRYMIFDEQGRIVSVVAPNPTTPRLKEMIKSVLEQKD